MQRINLPFAEYQFLFEAEEAIKLPAYSGSMWRGAFGHVLKNQYCCGQQKHSKDCIYSFLFEPQLEHYNAIMPFPQSPPTPYIVRTLLNENKALVKKEKFGFNLVLVGTANQQIETVIKAISQAALQGIGKGKGKAHLKEVVCYQDAYKQLIYKEGVYYEMPKIKPLIAMPPTNNISINLLTPLVLKQKYQLDASAFIMSIVRRISLLQCCYTDYALEYDFTHLKQLSSQVQIQKQIQRASWKRYSERQQGFQIVHGWMGTFILSGDAIVELLPFLQLGQWLHTGKMTNMGMGRYELQYMECL